MSEHETSEHESVGDSGDSKVDAVAAVALVVLAAAFCLYWVSVQ